MLRRDELVGRTIVQVLQTPWRRGYLTEYCEVFVEMAGGQIVRLAGSGVQALAEFEIAPLGLIPAEFRGPDYASAHVEAAAPPCAGERIEDVVLPDRELRWDSCALLLSGRRLLCLAGHGNSFGPRLLSLAELSPGAALRPYGASGRAA